MLSFPSKVTIEGKQPFILFLNLKKHSTMTRLIRFILGFGLFIIAQNVSAQCDNIQSACDTIVAGGHITVSAICNEQSVTIFNDSDFFEGIVITIDWGDNTIETFTTYQASFNHVYDFSDTCVIGGSLLQFVNICAYYECNNGQDASQHFAIIPISVEVPPVAGFEHAFACAGEEVLFTDTSCVNSNTPTWLWDFGVNPPVYSMEQNPAYPYENPGDYIVTLTVTNGCGISIDTQIVHVYDIPIAQADFEVNGVVGGNGCIGDTISLDGLNSEETVSYCWIISDTINHCFVDTTFKYFARPKIVFKEAGNHTVYLVASNGCGGLDTLELLIPILDTPTIEIEPVEAACNFITWTPNVVYSFGENTYEWEFTNGSIFSSNIANPTVEFMQTGSYSVTVTNECGATTASGIIEVNQEPTIEFEPIEELCSNDNPIPILVSPVGGTYLSYPPGFNPITEMFTPSSDITGDFYVVYETGLEECSTIDSLLVTVNLAATVSIELPSPVCLEDAPFLLSASIDEGTFEGNGVDENQFSPTICGFRRAFNHL